MMKKRAKVHLLPTKDKRAVIGLTADEKTLWFAHSGVGNSYGNKHLYITTDDEIKEDDTWINLDTNTIHNGNLFELANRVPSCKKIIATTDPELHNTRLKDCPINPEDNMVSVRGVAKPSKEFIEEYCRVGGIDEVDVEYGRTMDGTPTYNRLALTSNNEIIIHLIDQEKRDCLIAFDDWFNKNWYPEQYSILAIEAYLKTIQ